MAEPQATNHFSVALNLPPNPPVGSSSGLASDPMTPPVLPNPWTTRL